MSKSHSDSINEHAATLAKLAGTTGVMRSAEDDIREAKKDFARRREAEADFLQISKREQDDSTAPWEMFASQLRGNIQGGATWGGLQLVTTPTSAAWDDPVLGNWRAWRKLGDTISTWGPSYLGTSLQVTTGYETFIDNLAIPQPVAADQKKADDARIEFMGNLRSLSATLTNVGPHWATFDGQQASLPPNRRKTFDQWYSMFDGKLVAAAQLKVNGSAQKYQHWFALAYGGYAFAANLILDFANDAYQLPAVSPDGLNLSYRTYNIDPKLADWIAQSKQLPPGTPSRLAIDFNHTTHHDHSEESRWGGSASLSFGFFSFGGSAGGSRYTANSSDTNFRMSFSARNMETFTITPGRWFNATAVKAFKNGPWVPGGPVADGTIKLFGPGGVFNLIPSAIVVAYRPKVSAVLATHDYAQVKTSFSAGGGFSVGPFGFGASYGTDTNDVTWDDAHNSFTAEASTDAPQLVAIVSSVLPDFT